MKTLKLHVKFHNEDMLVWTTLSSADAWWELFALIISSGANIGLEAHEAVLKCGWLWWIQLTQDICWMQNTVVSYSRNQLLYLFVSWVTVVESLHWFVECDVFYFALCYTGTLFDHGPPSAMVDDILMIDCLSSEFSFIFFIIASRYFCPLEISCPRCLKLAFIAIAEKKKRLFVLISFTRFFTFSLHKNILPMLCVF